MIYYFNHLDLLACAAAVNSCTDFRLLNQPRYELMLSISMKRRLQRMLSAAQNSCVELSVL
jgi:hypothetical protein